MSPVWSFQTPRDLQTQIGTAGHVILVQHTDWKSYILDLLKMSKCCLLVKMSNLFSLLNFS